jgi:AraC-like DNA-binding protein
MLTDKVQTMRRHGDHLTFEEWQENLCAVCGRFDAKPAANSDFIGKIGKKDLHGLDLAYINSNVERMIHRKNASERNAPFCFLVFQRSGSATFLQAGEKVTACAGQLVLIDSASAFEIELHGLSEQFSLHLNRESVCEYLPKTIRKFGKIEANSLSGRLLGMLVEQIIGGSEGQIELQNEEGGSLERSVVSLLGPALQSGHMAPASQPSENLYRLAVREIDRNLKNPGLCATSLAAHLNISTRKLYRAFEKYDKSVHHYIIARRVQRAAQDLIDPRLGNRPISAIAHDLGFCDSSHFNKTFRKFYRFSPREYRAEFQAHP